MDKGVIGDSLNNCPYNAQNCPKIEDIKTDVIKLIERLDNLTKIIYVLIGVILCETGVLIW